MANTTPRILKKDAPAVAEQTARGFAALSELMDTCAEAINQNTETIRVMRDTQEEDVQRRIDLMKATQDAAIYAEFTARQSRYLAGVSTTIRERSGVELSTHDILMGILNGIENSDFNLTRYGTREEIAQVIEAVMKQGIHAIRSQLNE